MKKFLPLLLLLGMGSSAYAGGIVSSHTSSVQLTVDAARTDASRIGSSFSISGSNIDTTDGTTAGTVSAGTIASGVYSPGTIAATQDTAGAAFSFSQSYTEADDVLTSAPSVGAVSLFSDQPLGHLELLVTCWYSNKCRSYHGNSWWSWHFSCWPIRQ